jgi:hypothetical protein
MSFAVVEHPRTLTLIRSASMSIYYVYIYRHPKTKVPFYVGYGKNQRHLDHLNEAIKSPVPQPTEHKLNTIRKILREGLEPIIEIVDSGLSKEIACELEIFLISEIGRADKNKGPLTNQTYGGDGNRDWTPRLRKMMSERSKGMIMAKDPKTGEKIKVHKDDPRWVSGDLVGQNFQEVSSNINGKLDGYILAKDLNGVVYRVKPDDMRWVSGELVGINKGNSCHENTRKAASLTHKGKPKSDEQNKKASESIKLLKWYCNFEQNKVCRFREGEQPAGFLRVSGPHKRKLVE